MSIRKYLTAESLTELVKYSTFADYSKGHVAFSGAPKKHPYDKEKIILILDPWSSHTMFYEFRIADIAHVDELPQMVTASGESLTMVRIWVKKGSFGVRYEPFVVEDTVTILKDTAFFSKSQESDT
jgi:inorganic pyrophosphatase